MTGWFGLRTQPLLVAVWQATSASGVRLPASSGCQVRHKHRAVACHTGKSDSGGRRGLDRVTWGALILDPERGVPKEVMLLALWPCEFAGLPKSPLAVPWEAAIPFLV